MANLHLVTGYAGQAHVTAADDGSFNTAIFGNGQYVLDIGSKFAASVVSNNKITIADGDLLMQGRHVRLNEGTTVDLTITNGTQGKLRNDLIVARYTKDSVSGVEQVNLVVIQGTAVDSDPADPEYTSGDIINDHALLNDMPLYRVPLNGLTVGTPVALFSMASVMNRSNFNDLGGISITKLWENDQPTKPYPPQTLDINLTDYPHLIVTFMLSYYEQCQLSIFVAKGTPGVIVAATGESTAYSWHRKFNTSNSSIQFDHAYYTYNSGPSPNALIPYQIYGIKGVTDG